MFESLQPNPIYLILVSKFLEFLFAYFGIFKSFVYIQEKKLPYFKCHIKTTDIKVS